MMDLRIVAFGVLQENELLCHPDTDEGRAGSTGCTLVPEALAPHPMATFFRPRRFCSF